MILGISSFDFEGRRISFVIPEGLEKSNRQVNDLISICTARGFDHISVSESPTSETTQGRVVFSYALTMGVARYSFIFSDRETTPQDITDAVLIVSAALGLDERAAGQLRLAAYELCTNTVEHGDFNGRNMRISLGISAIAGHMLVIYKDNADTFATTNHIHISVADKIKDREKRGLGLFILNKMIGSMTYKRMGAWNVTYFQIETQTHETNWRKGMSTFEVKIISHASEGTVIIQPKGSIDSSTVQTLEPQLRSVIEAGTKRVVIDFSGVDFISSAGVGIFLGTVSELREKGGDLLFACVPKHIDEVFEIINIKSFFTTLESLDELDSVPQ